MNIVHKLENSKRIDFSIILASEKEDIIVSFKSLVANLEQLIWIMLWWLNGFVIMSGYVIFLNPDSCTIWFSLINLSSINMHTQIKWCCRLLLYFFLSFLISPLSDLVLGTWPYFLFRMWCLKCDGFLFVVQDLVSLHH